MKPDALAQRIIELAAAAKVKIVLAESCTGGLIAATLTNISGASSVLDRGLVTYSNQAKQDLLAVPEATLQNYGAVSSQTAIAMCTGGLAMTLDAHIAASVTGIAGPGGGSADKPVGLVHFACQMRGKKIQHEQHIFSGDRTEIRQKALVNSLMMIYNELK